MNMMQRKAARILLAVCLLAYGAMAPAQVPGPIYDLLDEYRTAMNAGDTDYTGWANRIYGALQQYPEEEWSTRIRAWEELGSIYWRVDQYEEAAPVFLELWREAEQRGDSDTAVTSLDHLTNLYTEAQFPIEDVRALYDATESWLREPPPGKEDYYAGLLLQVYSERAAREEGYAQLAAEDSDVQMDHLAQAEYFRGLAQQARPVEHQPQVTMARLTEIWFAKKQAPEEAPSAASTPSSPAPSQPVPGPEARPEATPAPPPVKQQPGINPKPSLPEVPPASPPPGLPTEYVVIGFLAVILAGWGLTGYIYLKRRR